MQRTIDAEGREVAEPLAEKGGELGPVHLARGHREGAMVDRAKATCMTIDRHIVRRVGEHHHGAFLAHQRGESRGFEGRAAEQVMATEQPLISNVADLGAGRNIGYRIGRIVIVLGQALERSDPQIDLADFEAGDLDAEIEPHQRELRELLGKQPVVPGRDLGQPIVGDHERASLRRRQMVEAYRRYLGNAHFPTGQHSAIAGNYLALSIDQDRNDEVEGFQAVADLANLLLLWCRGLAGSGFNSSIGR